MITLLAGPPRSSHNPQSFMLSALVHSAGIAMLYAGFMENPRIIEPHTPQRDSVRLVEMHMPKPKISTLVEATSTFAPPVAGLSSAGKRAVHVPAPRRPVMQPSKSLQTIVQPSALATLEIPQDLLLPSLLMWSAKDSATKEINLRPAQNDQAANVQPSITPPNEEKLLADTGIVSSALSAQTLPILPSTTSPIVIRGPEAAQHVPETASLTTKPPTEATVLSLSDLLIKDGTVALPRINEVSASPSVKTTGRMDGSSGAVEGAKAESALRDGLGSGVADEHSTSRISTPKDGSFGLVIVGASPEDQYPAAAGIWSGRLVYTVYLHVGAAKNWILQYSQPRTAEAGATGSASSLQSPWPTNMVVPNLGAGFISADAVLVHGFVNKAGRFEDLAVVFPTQFAMTAFVLNSLRQWEFRPAASKGVATGIEILLIIPAQD